MSELLCGLLTSSWCRDIKQVPSSLKMHYSVLFTTLLAISMAKATPTVESFFGNLFVPPLFRVEGRNLAPRKRLGRVGLPGSVEN
ncbi:hypothetical protein BDZ89DRAFT_387205 [Hymenopellis radicata]|nr:hypothetical protein BDZ89DRAFT_387205 [Hymenopellis radicata]